VDENWAHLAYYCTEVSIAMTFSVKAHFLFKDSRGEALPVGIVNARDRAAPGQTVSEKREAVCSLHLPISPTFDFFLPFDISSSLLRRYNIIITALLRHLQA
jgi:hypothetical protein